LGGGVLHNIQLTPLKLSAARKNLPGATGVGFFVLVGLGFGVVQNNY